MKNVVQTRVDDETYEELLKESRKQDRSLANVIRIILKEWMKGRKS